MSTTIFVTPDVYKRILDDPNHIVVEAQGEPPLILKAIGFPCNRCKRCRKNYVKMRPPQKMFGAFG